MGPPCPSIRIKRIYAEPEECDGFRVLVDRLWPRGITKDRAKIDLWLKDIAPSEELRRWFGHDPAKWEEFQARYFLEIGSRRDLLEQLLRIMERGRLTLVYAAKEEHFNNAVALKNFLGKQWKSVPSPASPNPSVP